MGTRSNGTRFGLIILLMSMIAMLVSASVDNGYGKSQGYVQPKLSTPKEHVAYEKLDHKLTAKPVVQKEGYKIVPKVPAKPVIQKEEHGLYEKTKSRLPTKVVTPKEEHSGYDKNYPKLPTKPMIPNYDPTSYKKGYSKVPKTDIPVAPKVLEHPKNIAVQGLVYCKYGPKLLPLQGATVRVTCLAVHKNGYESAPFSFSSCPADKKGYFIAKIPLVTLIKDDLWEITECKAFLENSPWTSCKVPEDTNGGITGANLKFSHHLNNGYCLSSVGPFIYNPGHESFPKEGY